MATHPLELLEVGACRALAEKQQQMAKVSVKLSAGATAAPGLRELTFQREEELTCSPLVLCDRVIQRDRPQTSMSALTRGCSSAEQAQTPAPYSKVLLLRWRYPFIETLCERLDRAGQQ